MGGCMSSPKDLKEGEAPVEPITPKAAAEGEIVAQENKEGGENEVEKKEEPLVDLSEPAKDEAKPEEAEAAPAETKEEKAKPEEAPVEKDKSDAPLVTV